MEVLFFGIAKDIVGTSQLAFSATAERPATVAELKRQLLGMYPDFSKLSSMAVAVNNEYAEDDVVLKVKDEIAIIPPVSGG